MKVVSAAAAMAVAGRCCTTPKLGVGSNSDSLLSLVKNITFRIIQICNMEIKFSFRFSPYHNRRVSSSGPSCRQANTALNDAAGRVQFATDIQQQHQITIEIPPNTTLRHNSKLNIGMVRMPML